MELTKEQVSILQKITETLRAEGLEAREVLAMSIYEDCQQDAEESGDDLMFRLDDMLDLWYEGEYRDALSSETLASIHSNLTGANFEWVKKELGEG